MNFINFNNAGASLLEQSTKNEILSQSQDNERLIVAKLIPVEPVDIDKNKGINIRAKGIKFLKISSWVNDIEIQ